MTDTLKILRDVAIGLISFLCVYLFNAVMELPEKYILKQDYERDQARVHDKLERMDEKLDKIMETMVKGLS